MSLPKVAPWAAEVNFPAGASPWSGQICKVQPAGDQFIPNTKPAAESHNWLFNQLTTAAQGAIDGLCYDALNSFSLPVTDPAGSGFTLVLDVKWNFAGQNWISASDDSGTTKLATSQDGGDTWQLIGSGSIGRTGGTALAVAVAQNGVIAVAANLVSTGFVEKVVGTTYTSTNVASLNNITFATGEYFTGLFHFFSGVQSGGSFTATWITSPDASTWTSRSLPAGFAAGTNHIGQVLTAFDSSHTALGMLVGLCGVTAGADTSKLMLVLPATPTAATDVTPGVLTAKIITGLAYAPGIGANQGTFGLLAYDGTSTSLYTCLDPSVPGNWTLVKTFTSLRLDALQAIGQVWVSTLTQNGLRRAVVSTEPTGVQNWAYTTGVNGSWAESGLPFLVSGAAQSVALFNAANVTVSGQAGCLQGAIV